MLEHRRRHIIRLHRPRTVLASSVDSCSLSNCVTAHDAAVTATCVATRDRRKWPALLLEFTVVSLLRGRVSQSLLSKRSDWGVTKPTSHVFSQTYKDATHASMSNHISIFPETPRLLTENYWLIAHSARPMHHLAFGINFQIHFVSLTSPVWIHVIHLSIHLCHHRHSHHPLLIHFFIPGSKPIFSTIISTFTPLGWRRGGHLCRVADNTVWSHWQVASRSSEVNFTKNYTLLFYLFYFTSLPIELPSWWSCDWTVLISSSVYFCSFFFFYIFVHSMW